MTVAFDLGQNNVDRLADMVLRPDGTGILLLGSVERGVAGDTDFGIAQLRGDVLFADGCESGDLSAW